MNAPHVSKIATELGITPKQVEAVAALLADEATVPFIARYRKEATGGLDEVAIMSIRDRLSQLRELDKRRETILKTIEEQGKLTDDLRAKIEAAETLSALEDLYLPYRPKRRTRGTVAKEKGLEPLATKLLEQVDLDVVTEATSCVDAEKGVESVEEALAGARDIIAEWINEDQTARESMRRFFSRRARFQSKAIAEKADAGTKYKDYFDWSEAAAKAPSHRVLAMRRGEKEGVLFLRVLPDEEPAVKILERQFIKADNAAAAQVREAIRDGYKRLLSLSMETEVRQETKKRADEEAIRVFALNLRQLLLAPPLGRKNVMAIDPGLRTGCKVVCLDKQGKLLHHEAIYPHPPKKDVEAAAKVLQDLCERYEIEAVAIGNGTAGRETERFIRSVDLPASVLIVMVDESGASVYSASKVARQELPKYDVTVRGSASIGRRLMDPLAELVKIDPKSIGVGQYQHDVDQPALRRSLDDVVSSCVNAVGVEVNTASRQLLTYVSGFGSSLAKGIVDYRDKHGPFRTREELKNVPRLGPKAFEQAAGFLRIRDGENPLDASAVHPESYPIVDAMAADLSCKVADLMREEDVRFKVNLHKYVSETVGMPTLIDIMTELAKPGRDPRETFEEVRFKEGVEKLEDLEPGMELPGVVTNITDFGAFVDVGVHQDGLVHVSELANRFVKHPSEVVKLRDRVKVRVLTVDLERKRIALSMKSPQEKPERRPEREGRRPERAERKEPRKTRSPRKTRPERPSRESSQAPTPPQPTKKRGSNNPFADLIKD